MKHLILLSFLLIMPVYCFGQNRANQLTPKWMLSVPKANSTYVKYETVLLRNPKGQSIGVQALGELSRKINNDWTIQSRNMFLQANETERDQTRIVRSDRIQIDTIEVYAEGKIITVNCVLADEWWVDKRGENHYYALYQVASNDYASFDRVYPTNDYGVGPLFMSLIPGTGQFYKGDAMKGSLFLGGCVLGGTGILLLENQRRVCITQMSQTHDINLIKRYSADERNYMIARNVTIGITGALYIFNLIDAAIAPGARRVKTFPGGINYSF